jgi:formate dehydrogenase subunit delta
MSDDALATLVRMANQIAANVAHHSYDEAVELVTSHLRLFWAPPMRADIIAYLEGGGTGLDPIARDAVHILRGVRDNAG